MAFSEQPALIIERPYSIADDPLKLTQNFLDGRTVLLSRIVQFTEGRKRLPLQLKHVLST